MKTKLLIFFQPHVVTSATTSMVTSSSHVTSEMTRDADSGAAKTTVTQHDTTQVVLSSTSEQVKA